jgi:multiple sugar transport system permease protein
VSAVAKTTLRPTLPAEIRRRRALQSIANHALAITFGIAFALPFLIVLATALMTRQQSLSGQIWPHPFRWSNFTQVFSDVPLIRYTINTVVYAGLSAIGTVVSCIPVAYAISRMRWRGRQAVWILILSTLMLPAQVTIVPLYVTFDHLHWLGSLKPLIVPSFFGDAFSILLLRQFFMTIPQDLSDAARIDGANEWQIMTKVIVPLARPAIAAVGLFAFLYAWDDFFGPLLYTGSNSKAWTLAVGLQQFTSTHNTIVWNTTMAAAVLFMVPVVVIFFFAQRVFVEGVTLTGVKG